MNERASDAPDRGFARAKPTTLLIVHKVAWRFMPILMGSYFFAFFDRISIGFAKNQLQNELKLTATAYGLGASLFVVGYVLFELPGNVLLYRLGPRRWIARIMATWGMATAAMVFVTTDTQFYVMRFLIGAAEAGFAPGVLYYFTIWFPRSFRGRITSMLFLASACSGLIGAPIASLILTHMDGVMKTSGWRWLFVAGGLPPVGLAVLIFTSLKDKIEDAEFLTEAEKARLSEAIAREHHDAPVGSSLTSTFRTPGFLTLGGLYFLIQIASYGLNFWVPTMIHASGIESALTVGLLTSVPYVMGAVLMMALGRQSDISGHRTTFLSALLVTAALGFVLAGWFAHDPRCLTGALGLMGGGIIAAVPMFYTLPAKILVGAGAASGIAIINTLGQLGGIVSPILIGRIRDTTGSTTPALYIIAGLCLLAAAMSAFALPHAVRERER